MSGRRWIAPAVLVALCAIAATVWIARPDPAPPAAVEVESASVYQFTTLAELTATSDLVVAGEVVAVERGSVVGSPGAAVVARDVTIAVDDVLVGATVETVVVEEEGWLTDGRPLVVDGLRAPRPGDRGVWFLDAIDSSESPRYLVINAQGRYLTDGSTADDLSAATTGDPLVAELAALGYDGLLAAVAAQAPSSSVS